MNRHFVVSGIGELLWDMLPGGKQLGGAPFNFAWHAFQVGCESHVISAVGDDAPGQEIISCVGSKMMHTGYIQHNDFPTGTVSVQFIKNGHPDYIIHEAVAWDHLVWTEELGKLAGRLDAVCFGSLAQRSDQTAETLQRLLSGLRQDCLRVFDVNLRQAFYDEEIIRRSLERADILKVNDSELPVIAGYHGLTGDSITQLENLLQHYHFRCIAFTMGGAGSILISSDEYSLLEAPRVDVADTVGAGDAFTAMLVTGVLKGLPLRRIHQMATEVAAFVCTQKGATPELPEALIKQFIN